MKFIKLIGLAGIVFSSLCNAQAGSKYILNCEGNIVHLTTNSYDVKTMKVVEASFDLNDMLAYDVKEYGDFRLDPHGSVQLVGKMFNGGGFVNIARYFDGHIELTVYALNKTYQCKVTDQ